MRTVRNHWGWSRSLKVDMHGAEGGEHAGCLLVSQQADLQRDAHAQYAAQCGAPRDRPEGDPQQAECLVEASSYLRPHQPLPNSCR
jgi:hypothetical protein